ncbi:MAG: transcriptional regulator NrdR [Armatimonadota bacterium]|nr:transcriptional regulator NrdR [Armatimonadota bacterium]MDW8026307.1 transcriptional regulator NrdR [Armatimonadota bacterium]
MKCPLCGSATKVTDTRLTELGMAVRRRRQCLKCQHRFTTYERIALEPLVVIKKDGRRELFDRGKVETGMMKACEKRPISYEAIQKAAAEIEEELRKRGVREVTSREIGRRVMDKLLKLDDVAYIRFASVYQEFDDAHKFAEALAKLNRLRRRRNQRKQVAK